MVTEFDFYGQFFNLDIMFFLFQLLYSLLLRKFCDIEVREFPVLSIHLDSITRSFQYYQNLLSSTTPNHENTVLIPRKILKELLPEWPKYTLHVQDNSGKKTFSEQMRI